MRPENVDIAQCFADMYLHMQMAVQVLCMEKNNGTPYMQLQHMDCFHQAVTRAVNALFKPELFGIFLEEQSRILHCEFWNFVGNEKACNKLARITQG